jgi:sialic acid synthase SpsE
MRIADLHPSWQSGSFPYCYVIGEIGINHNGDLSVAKKLIEMAKTAGCDAVKFQKRDPEVAVPKQLRNTPRETPWGTMSYLEYKNRIEFGRKEYDEISAFCKELSIEWSASAWDLGSQEFLNAYDLKFNKVASAMITNEVFLTRVANEGKITFVSTVHSEGHRSRRRNFPKSKLPFSSLSHSFYLSCDSRRFEFANDSNTQEKVSRHPDRLQWT